MHFTLLSDIVRFHPSWLYNFYGNLRIINSFSKHLKVLFCPKCIRNFHEGTESISIRANENEKKSGERVLYGAVLERILSSTLNNLHYGDSDRHSKRKIGFSFKSSNENCVLFVFFHFIAWIQLVNRTKQTYIALSLIILSRILCSCCRFHELYKSLQ